MTAIALAQDHLTYNNNDKKKIILLSPFLHFHCCCSMLMSCSHSFPFLYFVSLETEFVIQIPSRVCCRGVLRVFIRKSHSTFMYSSKVLPNEMKNLIHNYPVRTAEVIRESNNMNINSLCATWIMYRNGFNFLLEMHVEENETESKLLQKHNLATMSKNCYLSVGNEFGINKMGNKKKENIQCFDRIGCYKKSRKEKSTTKEQYFSSPCRALFTMQMWMCIIVYALRGNFCLHSLRQQICNEKIVYFGMNLM